MNDYSFIIQRPYYRNKKLPVALLHFTAGFLLLSAFLESGTAGYPRWIAYGFLVLGVLELVYTFFAARLQRNKPLVGGIIRIVTALAFLLYAVLLLIQKQTFFGICMILIAFAFTMIYLIERRWSRPFILKVNEKGIWFPRFFKYQLFPWKDLNLVLLKGNLITLDFKNNRVAQLEVDAMPTEAGNAAFNSFCLAHTKEFTVA